MNSGGGKACMRSVARIAKPGPLEQRGLSGNNSLAVPCDVASCSVGQRLPLLGFWELTCF